MLIYKLLTAGQWAGLQRRGQTAGAPADIADGFIHFSTGAQVAATAAKHFAGRDGLMLLAVETRSLDDALRWEPARGGALFPHLYSTLRLSDVVWARPLPLGPGGVHAFPEGVGS
jgi:uncharacterized protein (DUF952 family)